MKVLLREKLFLLLSFLGCLVVASEESETSSSSFGLGFWLKLILFIVYAALGYYLYRERGVSRVFVLYLGLGAALALVVLLFSINWSALFSSEQPIVEERLVLPKGQILVGKLVYLNGMSGDNAQYNGDAAYVKSYNPKSDEYVATRTDRYLKFLTLSEVSGLKRTNLGVHAVLYQRVKEAQRNVDSTVNALSDAEREISLREAQAEDAKRAYESAQLIAQRKEFTVGTKVVYGGRNAVVVAVHDTPQGKRYDIRISTWTSWITDSEEIKNVEITKLALQNGVAAQKAVDSTRAKHGVAMEATKNARAKKAMLESTLIKNRSLLEREEKLSQMEKDQMERAKSQITPSVKNQKVLSI